MLQLRRMTEADIPLGMRLKAEAGWNQTEADWRRFLALGGDGCFVAEWDGQPVATAATFIFGTVGWIAMVLVDPPYRHRGIATRLVQHALEYFDRRGLAAARLDATALGRPVYERLGFVAEYELLRMEGLAAVPPAEAAARGCSPVAPSRWEPLIALDRLATGTPRRPLLERLLTEQPQCSWTTGEDSAVEGYLISRPGSRAVQLGPAAAMTAAAGRQLMDCGLQHWAGHRVYVDVPSDNAPAVQCAAERGLTVQRSFVRMVRGLPVADRVDLLWASSGPEKG